MGKRRQIRSLPINQQTADWTEGFDIGSISVAGIKTACPGRPIQR
jgi:hypothetical protein